MRPFPVVLVPFGTSLVPFLYFYRAGIDFIEYFRGQEVVMGLAVAETIKETHKHNKSYYFYNKSIGRFVYK